jgi:hypothetical protein
MGRGRNTTPGPMVQESPLPLARNTGLAASIRLPVNTNESTVTREAYT